MKITKIELKQIIKEELKTLNEQGGPYKGYPDYSDTGQYDERDDPRRDEEEGPVADPASPEHELAAAIDAALRNFGSPLSTAAAASLAQIITYSATLLKNTSELDENQLSAANTVLRDVVDQLVGLMKEQLGRI